MCGIVGIVSRLHAVDRELLVAAATRMRHRGPDGDGVWIAPDRTVGFAHRRLAVVDLSSNAAQPMLSPDGTSVIVFNGEIYNFRDVRAELAAKGFTFRTESDTEVLLTAYRVWGEACLDRLVGMFAFAIADLSRREVFLARDRVGEKPIFYRADGNGIVFASELKALLELPGTDRVVDPDALNAYLALGYVPADACILRGVRKLPAAHALLVPMDSGLPRVWQYWTLPDEEAPPGRHDLQDELERRLRASVRSQLLADVPVGVLLSGGLDSSLITAVAASESARPIRTFSVAFPGHGTLDESAHARLVAGAFSTIHTELVVDAGAVGVLPALAAQFDEPMADSSMIPTYLLSRAVREHVTVALGGDGGDELFGGYPHYSWLLRLESLKRWAPASARRVIAGCAQRLPEGVRGRNYLTGFGQDLGSAIAHTNLYFNERARRAMLANFAERLGQPWNAPEQLRASAGTGALSATGRMRRSDFRTYLPDDILVKVDRASMLASLEVRAPFLDHRLCEFAFALPSDVTVNERDRKILLRGLARKLLPPSFDSVRKQGFSLPLNDWLRGAWRPLIDAALDDLPAEWVSRREVAAVQSGFQAGLASSQRVFALAILSLWRREYGIRAS